MDVASAHGSSKEINPYSTTAQISAIAERGQTVSLRGREEAQGLMPS